MHPYPQRTGFTLIELAIVLVIIGLIVGGILVGKDLIHGAELRAGIGSIEKLETAIHTFTLKYNCLPGDCPNATDFLGTNAACPTFPTTTTSGTCNGNGDHDYRPWDSSTGGESLYATDQLVKSSLWQNSLVYTSNLILKGFPNRALAYIFNNDLYTGSGYSAMNGRDGNTITASGASGGCGNGTVMPAADAQNIDQKMDDGHASGGAVMGLTGAVTGPAAGCGAPDNSCLISGDYSTKDPVALCRMIFYW